MSPNIAAYSQQYQWRSWSTLLDALPNLSGQLVLDLGCGIGDLAADLSARGAAIIGIDFNDDVIAYANSRRIPTATFLCSELSKFHDPSICADGIWSSFTAAYFPEFRDVLGRWLQHLRPGGWLALTEIDHLFGHHPMATRTTELLELYAQDAINNSRYDFHMGRKLAGIVEQAGLRILHQFTVPDAELSFAGRATPSVREAWAKRLNQMSLLQKMCGPEFADVRDDFLRCLDRDDHYCTAAVHYCVAIKSES